MRILLCIVFGLLASSQESWADTGGPPEATVVRLEALFAPGHALEEIAFAVDGMVDSAADEAAGKAELDKLTANLQEMAGSATSSIDKLQVLRRFIYQPGAWNDNRPFSYDMADPNGHVFANRELGHYLLTRKGNCFTMPLLAAILGRRLGLKMTLALAPFHMFVKFTDDAGREWNLEATSGLGFTRDAYYRAKLPMTDLAVQKGTYLRALSETENAAVLATLVLQQDVQQHRSLEGIKVADVLLKHFPNYANGLLWRGSAYAMVLREQIVDVYQPLGEIPPQVKDYADALLEANRQDFAAAEALGWTEQDGGPQ